MKKIKKVGIIVADADEFAPLEEKIQKGEYTEKVFLKRKILEFKRGGAEICTILCGIGKVNAAAAAAHMVDTGCEIILNYGLSGGINGIRRGELCLCTEILEHDFDLTTIGYKPCEKPGQQSYIYRSDKRLNGIIKSLMPEIKEGVAVTGDCFVCDEGLKNFLRDGFGAM